MASTIKNAVAQRQNAENTVTTMDLVKKMMPGIKAALPSTITPERFTRIAMSALSTTPKLQECSGHSFLAALMTSAQLGLEPNTPLGQAYLIPYWNSKAKHYECQFQLGYKGLIDLAYRSGQVKSIQSRTVYEHDTFDYSYGLEQELRHIPAQSDRGEPTCFYCVVEFANGGRLYDVMSVDDVRKHAQRFSKSYQSGPWQTDFEAMAKKTVLKRVLKYAPLAAELARSVSQDGAVREQLAEDMSSVPSIADFEEIPAEQEAEVIQDEGTTQDP